MQGHQSTGQLIDDLPARIEADRRTPASSSVAGSKKAGGFNAAAHGLRGLAAVMVLFAHILGGTAKHIYADVPAYVEGIKAPWYLGTFGVELFFVISGFVIFPSTLRYLPQEFALRRFLRLYPLFFVLSLIFIVLNAGTNAYPKINSVETVVAGLLFLNLFTGTEQLTPNAWSLTYEVMFYLLVYGIVYFTVHKRNMAAAVIMALIAALFLAAFPIAVYFLMGVAIRLASRSEWSARISPRFLEVSFLLLTLLFASQGHFEYRWADFRHPTVIPIILSTGFYFYFAVMPGSLTGRALDNRLMRYLGTVSYSLYLVHPYTYFLARWAFDRYGLFTSDVGASIALFSGVVVLLTMPLTHLIHVSLELWPYQHFFRQRIYRRPGAEPAVRETAAS